MAAIQGWDSNDPIQVMAAQAEYSALQKDWPPVATRPMKWTCRESNPEQELLECPTGPLTTPIMKQRLTPERLADTFIGLVVRGR